MTTPYPVPQLWENYQRRQGYRSATNTAAGPDPTGTYKRPISLDNSLFYDIPREYYFGVRVEF